MPPNKDVWDGVLLISCFLQAGLVFGALRSFGVFFPEFVEYFGSAAGSVSWVTSCGVAVQQLMSPLGCALALRYGSRPVVMFGGLLASLGMFFASFATSLPHLYLSLGGLSGLGWALIFSPSMAAVTQSFTHRRSLATGFVLTGVGIMSFALTPLLQYLVEIYSWRGALLLLSGITLHSVPCGALLRPHSEESRGHSRSLLWGWELLCEGAFMRYCLAITLINTGYFVPFAHLVAHMRAKGVGEQHAALLMSLVGVADVGGRLFAGWLSDFIPRHNLPLLSFWTVVTGVILGLLPLAINSVEMGLSVVAFGFCAGALTPGVFSALPRVVGNQKVLPALGLLQMIESVGGLLGAPISGWLCDLTGNFTLSFAVSGTFLVIGGLIILMLPGICYKSSDSENTDPDKSLKISSEHLERKTYSGQKSESLDQPNGNQNRQVPILKDPLMIQVVSDLPLIDRTSQSENRTKNVLLSSDSTDQLELNIGNGSPPRERTDQSKSSLN
ncbi:monocarboxylate transporter 13 isoform X2 [Bombina bombina]|nr:monocarboxylate transporter 13 isoform X2 [Bombina bombina]XP_053574428.1 monocarboxylate transporter 13 isoform X2 [Bombina bombina]